MQRFLQEIGRRFPVEKVPRTEGQTVVDFYDPLNKSAPYLAPNQRDVIAQSVPMLRRDNFRVFVVVWATTPAEKAWIRAGTQAQLVAEEIANIAQLDSKARARLIPLGQPWRYPDLQRPIMSLVIVKTDAATGKH